MEEAVLRPPLQTHSVCPWALVAQGFLFAWP